MTIYALKATEEWNERIFDSLTRGKGRFGWSYVNADLRELKNRIEESGWDSLSDDEKNCYQEFLLRLEEDDYVVYINLPVWGECTVARVTGGYSWVGGDDDFNHRFDVCRESVRSFNRNDARVTPALSARLKLQGRWWTIHVEDDFRRLLEALETEAPAPRTSETSLAYLSEQIQPLLEDISHKISRTHPNRNLEPLVEKVFQSVPGVRAVKRQGGAGDHGADLIVDFEFGSIPGLVHRDTLVVQVKSFEGEIHNTRAIEDIRRAFQQYEHANQGLIVSTGTTPGENFRQELDKLQEDTGKAVAMLTGSEFAAFFLKFGGDLLDSEARTE